MGQRNVKQVPPFKEADMDMLRSINVGEHELGKLWGKFHEIDVDCNGFWTVNEFFRLIQEQKMSMRAPILNQLFFVSDGRCDGSLDFQDFAVSICSFCALSKEEVLQFLFMIVDDDRNGRIEKEELLTFFSFVPPEAQEFHDRMPMFPLNNKNALDKFRGGKWKYLEFDGLAQLCERFPYISYAVYHVQDLFRQRLLGHRFWNKLDDDRQKMDRRIVVTLPNGQKKRLERPGRCTMKEILDYSRRKTALQGGKRVAAGNRANALVGDVTKRRDEQIAKNPLMQMIRNSRCMYYVPPAPPMDIHKHGEEEELEPPTLELEHFSLAPGAAGRKEEALVVAGNAPWDTVGAEEGAGGDDESGEEDEDGEEEDGGDQEALPPLPPPAEPVPGMLTGG